MVQGQVGRALRRKRHRHIPPFLPLQGKEKYIEKVLKNQYLGRRERTKSIYRNLKAEQARRGHTNEFVAKQLGLSRSAYENKLRTGRFRVSEAKKLCEMYDCDFMYLFETEEECKGA